MTNTESAPVTNESMTQRPKDRELSGKSIVLSMVLLGLGMTILLFVYFEFNTRPFRPLREAIGREYTRSRPMVEGGRLKGRGILTLRISFSVPFDPSEGADSKKSGPVLKRTLELARQYHDLATFDQVEVNLIQFRPEKDAIRWQFLWQGAEAAVDLDATKYSAKKADD